MTLLHPAASTLSGFIPSGDQATEALGGDKQLEGGQEPGGIDNEAPPETQMVPTNEGMRFGIV
jgi:hypothetical protein